MTNKLVTPVEGSEIYLFRAPKLDAERVGKVYSGDLLKISETLNQFYYVTYANFLSGWVPSWMVYDVTNAPPQQEFKLFWPTDYKVVTQGFGLHPEWYNKFNLPGHEGLDIKAPTGSNVYAGANGKVYRVQAVVDGNPYGIHVRVDFLNGYKGIYAHLKQAQVSLDQWVTKGQIIGLADSTGNSTGSHLHFTLKKDNATKNKETNFPSDIIDPSPFFE